jgi:hypothetical protein
MYVLEEKDEKFQINFEYYCMGSRLTDSQRKGLKIVLLRYVVSYATLLLFKK